jgi:hypothetical protein
MKNHPSDAEHSPRKPPLGVAALDKESLQPNEALVRIAGYVAGLGGWSVDLAASRIAWSDEVCAIHEVPPGASPTLDEAVRYYAPEWRETITAAFEDCCRDGTPFDLEIELVGRQGAAFLGTRGRRPRPGRDGRDRPGAGRLPGHRRAKEGGAQDARARRAARQGPGRDHGPRPRQQDHLLEQGRREALRVGRAGGAGPVCRAPPLPGQGDIRPGEPGGPGQRRMGGRAREEEQGTGATSWWRADGRSCATRPAGPRSSS